MNVEALTRIFPLLALVAFLPVLVHAFRRSAGTGILVLCIPLFAPTYAFRHFEHPRKGPLLALWLALSMASVL